MSHFPKSSHNYMVNLVIHCIVVSVVFYIPGEIYMTQNTRTYPCADLILVKICSVQ